MTMIGVQGTWAYLLSELCKVSRRGPERSVYYRRLPDLLERNSKLVLYDDSLEQGVNLVHYTTWENALKMFDENQEIPVLRMYNYEQANDPEEGKIKPPEWKSIEMSARSDWIDDILGKSRYNWAEESSAYGCSFSSGPTEVEDDLTYWRLYGNNGQGCSLKISERSKQIYKVRYRDRNFDKRKEEDRKEDANVAKCLKAIFDVGKETIGRMPEEYKYSSGRIVAEGLLRIIYGYYHLIKHITYADENEWRMIRVMPPPNTVRFDTTSVNVIKRYVEGPALGELLTSASAITIGPTVSNRGAARAYLEHLAKEKHGIRNVDVKNSSQTYRRV